MEAKAANKGGEVNEAAFAFLIIGIALAFWFVTFGIPILIKYERQKAKRKQQAKRWTRRDEDEFNEEFMKDMRQFLNDVALLRGFGIRRRRRW